MQGCKEAGIPAFGTLWDFVSVITGYSALFRPLDDRFFTVSAAQREHSFAHARWRVPTLTRLPLVVVLY